MTILHAFVVTGPIGAPELFEGMGKNGRAETDEAERKKLLYTILGR